MRLTADSIRVDDDEGRIILLIDSDEEDTITVDIHAVALEFYAEVQRKLRPYALEAEHARAAMTPAYADAYDLDDPKHPTYYERMVD